MTGVFSFVLLGPHNALKNFLQIDLANEGMMKYNFMLGWFQTQLILAC